MKRLILILAVVCTVFIGFSSVGYAFSKGDVINGITLPQSYSDCDYWLVWQGMTCLLTSNDFVVSSSGKFSTTSTTSSVKVYGLRADGSCSDILSFTNFYLSDISDSSFDIYDESGKVVFPLAPPAEVPEVTTPGLEGITTELLLGVLRGLKPILLGLAVSVIGFLAFRKAWKWVLTQLRLG